MQRLARLVKTSLAALSAVVVCSLAVAQAQPADSAQRKILGPATQGQVVRSADPQLQERLRTLRGKLVQTERIRVLVGVKACAKVSLLLLRPLQKGRITPDLPSFSVNDVSF